MTNYLTRKARAARDAFLIMANPLPQLILVLVVGALVLVGTVYLTRDLPPTAFVLHVLRETFAFVLHVVRETFEGIGRAL